MKDKKKKKKNGKVRDHCHYTGEYRSDLHIIYNLKYIVPKKIHMVFKIDLTKIIILSKKFTRRILKTIYLFRRKYRKIHNS